MGGAGRGVRPGVKVEIWSDVVCPWCHIGKRRFEAALERFAHRDAVEVEWKSFELDPGAPSAAAGDPLSATEYAERLARKYGTSVLGAQQIVASAPARRQRLLRRCPIRPGLMIRLS